MIARIFRTKLERIVFIIFSLALSNSMLSAQTIDDKVIITHRSDTYTFFEKDGKMKARHDVKEEYKLNSNLSQVIQPSIIYSNDELISLKSASCSGSKAQYKSIAPEGIFFDGSQVCYFLTTLTPRTPVRTAKFSRVINDARYLARIDLCKQYFTQVHTVSMFFPKDMTPLRLIPMNLPEDTQVDTIATSDGTTITYTLRHCKPFQEETMEPPHQRIAPQILVTGLFRDHHELFHWESQFSVSDTVIPSLSTLLAEINCDSHSDIDRLRNTFQWVQHNIRYIAFEAGDASFQPDCPSEVLRKRYGDCKGMAMLLRTLLRAQGFDARLTDIGTTEIPYRISQYPTLAAANHKICTVFHQGHTYFLDATHPHLPLGYFPQSIQGKEAMIENGDDCILHDVPLLPTSLSSDSLYYEYNLTSDGILTGLAERFFSGDMKEAFMQYYESKKQGDRNQIIVNNLSGSNQCRVSNAQLIENDSLYYTVISGDIDNNSAVQFIENEFYLDVNPRINKAGIKIDTLKREHDAWFPVRHRTVCEVRVHLPQNYIVTHLPQGIELSVEQEHLTCTFSQEGNTIIFRQSMQLNNQHLPLTQISAWNKAIDRWNDTCNEQIIINREKD